MLGLVVWCEVGLLKGRGAFSPNDEDTPLTPPARSSTCLDGAVDVADGPGDKPALRKGLAARHGEGLTGAVWGGLGVDFVWLGWFM